MTNLYYRVLPMEPALWLNFALTLWLAYQLAKLEYPNGTN